MSYSSFMNGIISVLNTPFTASNTIDVEGLQRTVANGLEAGVSGFLVGGLASEVAVLSLEERVLILDATRDVVDGKVPLIGGAFGATKGERIEVAERLLEGGCDGIMASIPYDDPAEFEEQIQELASLDLGFLMVQDWDPKGVGIPVPVIVDLFNTIPNFTWLKIEVVPAGPKYTEVLARTDGKLKVAGGWAVMEMLDALDRGVHAFMPTAMHRIYTRIYTCYSNGERDEAGQLFREILPVLTFSNQNLETSIQFFKRLLFAQGVFETDRVRIPSARFDAEKERIADEMIERVMAIESSL